MHYLRFVFMLFALILFPIKSFAVDVMVTTDYWENYTNKDGTGFYLDVLKEAFPSSQYNLIIKHMPYKRTLDMVEKGKSDIALGVYSGDMSDDKYLAMKYIEIDEVDLLLKKDLAKGFKDLNSLKGKNVVAKIGYAFDGYFDVPVNYKEKPQLLGMMKMLKAGRVDAVLDYYDDMKNNWDKAGLDDSYTIVRAVIINKAYFAFADKSKGLKDHFLKVYPGLVKSGKIIELGKKYGIPESRLAK